MSLMNFPCINKVSYLGNFMQISGEDFIKSRILKFFLVHLKHKVLWEIKNIQRGVLETPI